MIFKPDVPVKKMLALFWALILCSSIQAQLSPIDLDIPMRDSLTLSGHLYHPDTTSTFPTILIMTPYGKFWYEINGLPLGIGTDILSSNYAVVIVDWRCRFGSISACAFGSSDAEDGYDVVEWIAQQSWSNGKIGTWGPSALGNIQYQVAAQKPPHLVCCVPEVSAPQFAYQKYLPGGSATVERMETLDVLFGFSGTVIANPHYNVTWFVAELATMYAQDITVPMFLIGGWFDLNTDQTLMMMDTLTKISADTVRDLHKLLMGPWVHGGTGQADVGSTMQGDLNFPEAENWNDSMTMRFFDYYLRNVGNNWDDEAEYTYFQMGENKWRQSESWPPDNTIYTSWYLHENMSILPDPPTVTSASRVYNYDPTDPSPTIGGKTLNVDLLQGPYDQSGSVETRNDVLVFSTNMLTSELPVQGTIKVNLFVSSDRKDTDFAVRLTEVYPDGKSILLGESIQRMRFRNGYTTADTSFLSSGNIYPVTLSLDDLATTFKSGNRLRIVISSSNYPRYNRNMNTGGSMYPDQNYDTLVNPLIAANSIFLNSTYSSNLEIPVSDEYTSVTEIETFEDQVLLYPNPAKGYLVLERLLPGSIITIRDLAGRTLKSRFTSNEIVTRFDISSLSEGIYFITVKSESHLDQTMKILIAD